MDRLIIPAITTKLLGATSTKPERVKATCESGSVIVNYKHNYFAYDARKEALVTLVKKLGLNKEKLVWRAGSLKTGYVFVATYN